MKELLIFISVLMGILYFFLINTFTKLININTIKNENHRVKFIANWHHDNNPNKKTEVNYIDVDFVIVIFIFILLLLLIDFCFR
jgi:hypothetical protein